jgi:hypothetical protein
MHVAVTYTRNPTAAEGVECGMNNIGPNPILGLVKVYVDGALAKCKRGNEAGGAGAIFLGATKEYTSRRGDFRGKLDDFAIYDRALDSAALAQISAGAANNAAMATIVRTVGGCP